MVRNSILSSILVLVIGLLPGLNAGQAPSLWNIVKELKSRRFVDLTHAFYPGIPHWPGFSDEVRTTVYYYDEGIGTKGSGFLAHEYCHIGAVGHPR